MLEKGWNGGGGHHHHHHGGGGGGWGWWYPRTDYIEIVDQRSPCGCSDIFDPVVGSDNRVYDNACLARCSGARPIRRAGRQDLRGLGEVDSGTMAIGVGALLVGIGAWLGSR